VDDWIRLGCPYICANLVPLASGITLRKRRKPLKSLVGGDGLEPPTLSV